MSRFPLRVLTLSLLAAVLTWSGGEAQSIADLSRDLQWRNIGPANMAGRVTDIEAVEADVGTFLVRITAGRETAEVTLTVRNDPGVTGVLPSVR